MFRTEKFDFEFCGHRFFGSAANVLHYAAQTGDQNRVKLLLSKGADINVQDAYGQTVLHYAAYSGNLELIKWLVAKGADINAKTDSGMTILEHAELLDHLELVKWLKEHGAKE